MSLHSYIRTNNYSYLIFFNIHLSIRSSPQNRCKLPNTWTIIGTILVVHKLQILISWRFTVDFIILLNKYVLQYSVLHRWQKYSLLELPFLMSFHNVHNKFIVFHQLAIGSISVTTLSWFSFMEFVKIVDEIKLFYHPIDQP